MFIILEWNGFLPEGFIGVMLQENGKIEHFATEVEAEKFAKENCAFEYKIIEL
jgi:hypothetical protein